MIKYSWILLLFFMQACSHNPPMPTVDYVDLNRFMGKWYVIANIPTFIEEGAYNATETYVKKDNGQIDTFFEFNKDGFDGELVKYNPLGTVIDDSNAIWTMQFIWPFQADYRIAYLDEDYQVTIIARTKRDYVWLMSRQPQMDEKKYREMQQFILNLGYDIKNLQRVPQSTVKIKEL